MSYDSLSFLCSDRINGQLPYPCTQNHSVFFLPEDSDELYVGGTDFVLKIDVDNNSVIEVGHFRSLNSFIYILINLVASIGFMALTDGPD